MYKPTFYITMEADPARFTPKARGWPAACGASPRRWT